MDHAVLGAVAKKITFKLGHPTLPRRPLQRLYLRFEHDVTTGGQQQCDSSGEQHNVVCAVEHSTSIVQVSRPKRTATIEADNKLKSR